MIGVLLEDLGATDGAGDELLLLLPLLPSNALILNILKKLQLKENKSKRINKWFSTSQQRLATDKI